MDRHEIRLIQESWLMLKPDFQQVGEAFYKRLFNKDNNHEIFALFKDNANEQGRKLMLMLNGAVQMLETPGQLDHDSFQLGVRHVDYGVSKQDFHLFGTALLETIECHLGDRFTERHYRAWVRFYQHLTQQMLKAFPK